MENYESYAARPRAVFIMGLPISPDSAVDVMSEMDRAIRAAEIGHYISITNTESMYHGLRIPSHGEYIRKADFSLCDGVGVIAAGWAWGHRIQRLNGPVLQLECSRYGVACGWRHFFYGGKEGVAEVMTEQLKARYPGLIVCGSYSPPFLEQSKEDDDEIVRIINEARPDIVWVGLGLVKQERWIAEHIKRIKAPWMVGVGAAFDYHSGAIPWAPPLLRRLGLEWAFRLILQPKLRGRRYWWSLVYVMESFGKALLSGRFLRKQG